MKKFAQKLVVCLLLLSLTIPALSAQAAEKKKTTETAFTKSQCALAMAERKLWMDHVSWTRSYIISAIANLQDQKDVAERLLQNQDEIAKSIIPYYGQRAGEKLAALLREHIELAGKVLDAAKANNKTDLDKYNKLWYQNADDIAKFLSDANPYLSYKELKSMLDQHLQFVTDQVVARLKGDWKADINAYDKGEEHMIHFADMLSDAIIKQFPEKFK